MPEQEILFLVFSYLVGSIPFGYLIFYVTDRKDIRTVGSLNIGATNVLRSKGKLAGLLTLALDIAKGALPVLYAKNHFDSPALVIAGGAAVVLGHVFPVFLKFHGGKGVGAFVGVLLAYDIPALLVFLIVFLGIVILTRFVSLGSVVGTGAVFFVILFTRIAEVSAIFFLMTLLIIIRHRSNIGRLLDGSERKINLRKNG